MAASGRSSCPPAGTFMTVSGQFAAATFNTQTWACTSRIGRTSRSRVGTQLQTAPVLSSI